MPESIHSVRTSWRTPRAAVFDVVTIAQTQRVMCLYLLTHAKQEFRYKLYTQVQK